MVYWPIACAPLYCVLLHCSRCTAVATLLTRVPLHCSTVSVALTDERPDTIACEKGLAYGVPVVTLPADFVRGRFALAMYTQMGYTDLVAENVEVRGSNAHTGNIPFDHIKYIGGGRVIAGNRLCRCRKASAVWRVYCVCNFALNVTAGRYGAASNDAIFSVST